MTFDEEQAFLAPWAEQIRPAAYWLSSIRGGLGATAGPPCPPSSIGFGTPWLEEGP